MTKIQAGSEEIVIESRFAEFGVERVGEIVFITDDETEARLCADLNAGTVKVREVFETAWADAPNA